jgi:hypothetical protein
VADVDVSQVVELRVHGVSGTPPQDLLDRPLVTQVAGDRIAGFYRPRLAVERTDTPTDSPATPGAPLEGYVWGGLTSGSPSRALWLLLLPFTLVNVAPRLRPPDPPARRGARPERRIWLLWYVSRLTALSLTMMFSLAFAGIGLDLLGWQCASANQPCRNGSPGWLIGRISEMATGPRLAIGALLPLVVLAALSLISGGTISRYEATNDRVAPADNARAVEPALDSAWMWRGEHLARRLRHLHLQAGMAVVLASVAWPIESAWRIIVLLAAAAATGQAVVLLALPAVFGREKLSRGWDRLVWSTWGVLGVVAAVTAVLFLTSAVTFTGRTAPQFPARTTGLPHFAATLIWFFAVQLVLVVTLTIVVWSMRFAARPVPGDQRGPRPGIGSNGTLVLTLFGVFLAAVFSSGVYIYAAAWLHTGSLRPSFRQAREVAYAFDVPEAIRDASLTFALSVAVLVIAVILLGLIGLAVYLRIGPHSPPLVGTEFAQDYPDRLPPRTGRARVILRAFWRARLVDLGGLVVGLLLLPGTAITLVITVILLARPWSSWAARQADTLTGQVVDGWLPATGAFSATNLQGVGAYLVVLLLVLLVALGAAAYRVPKTRRVVGILWDLASFWPRSAHPLAAPCYAERSVPDLTTRIRWYIGGSSPSDYPTGAVVLAGHSQGTVISAAVLLQLRTTDAELPFGQRIVPRVAYLSYGCVLRRLYARYFPAYFGPRTLDRLADALGPADRAPMRWRNLWRHSDPIGGPVASGPPHTGADATGSIAAADRRLIDPRYDVPPGDTSDPPVRGHSGFPADPVFQRTVAELAGTLPEPPPPPAGAAAGTRANAEVGANAPRAGTRPH